MVFKSSINYTIVTFQSYDLVATKVKVIVKSGNHVGNFHASF